MTSHNILITSIGSFSADCAIKTLNGFTSGKIYGCDIFPSHWHHIFTDFEDVFLAPKVKDEKEYFDFIIQVCQKYKIGMIIPLTDIEVDFFNNNRTYFEHSNIIVTIANQHFLKVARNKKNLTNYVKKISGLNSIPSYSIKELSSINSYPLIAKPLDGRSSEGVYILSSYCDLSKSLDNDNYIFQELILGKICTVDYVRSSKYKSDFCIPRWEHLRTKNGAGMTVETFHSSQLQKIVTHIGNDLNVNGAINFEFISKNNFFYLIDINPRFSAGIGFSKLAGYDFVKSHVNCFTGQNILPSVEYSEFIAEKKMVEVVNKELN